SRLVRKGVLADDRLVTLDDHPGDARNEPADAAQFLGVDAGRQLVIVLPRAEGHDQLFERGGAGPFAQAVDRALDLPRTRFERRQAVGYRQTEVVVAVRA